MNHDNSSFKPNKGRYMINKSSLSQRVLRLAVTSAFTFGLSASALAGPPTDFVKSQTKDVTKILSKKETKARAKKLDKILQQSVDFRELASRSLKGHWEKQTPEAQEQFLNLLQRMLEANYTSKLSGKKLGEDYSVEYLDEKTRGDLAIVKTRVLIKEDKKPVSYKLTKKNDTWIVFDIVIDDISLEETYRESYTAIIEDEGWDSLIDRMKAKVVELEAANK